MKLTFKSVEASSESIDEAAKILKTAFVGLDKDAWLDLENEVKEVLECIEDPNICIGVYDEANKGELCGWVGLRPLYPKTWELHPLIVKWEYRKMGVGRRLITELEKIAQTKGIIGIVLGTDDETGSTSLSEKEINGNNVFEEIRKIKNLKNHPYEFYRRCGYTIVGLVPDANGKGKPDIWMWKRI